MNLDRLYSDLKVKGYHDVAYYSYDTEREIKNKGSRLRKGAKKVGFKVSVKKMKDEEGTFLRAEVKA